MSSNYRYAKTRLMDEIFETQSSIIRKNMKKPMEIYYGSTHFIGDPRDENHIEQSIRELESQISTGYDGKFDSIIEEEIKSTLPETSDDSEYFYHSGYLEYLICAWDLHMGIEIGPWHLWSILLWNLKEINRARPHIFKSLWTTSNKKSNLIMFSKSFDIIEFTNVLKSVVPENTIETLVPEFESQPQNFTEHLLGLIGEISQDYYKIMILACNIPEVKILGNENDWSLLISSIRNVKDMYSKVNDQRTNRYLDKVEEYFEKCISNLGSQDYWLNFFSIDKCGSGSQQAVSGHIKELFTLNEIVVSKLPQLVSKVPYNFVGNESYCGNFISGVLCSSLETSKSGNQILCPRFDHITTKIDVPIDDLENMSKTSNLIRMLSFVNKCSRNPIYNAGHLERTYIRTWQDMVPLLGEMKLETYLEMSKQMNPNLDVDITRENIERALNDPKNVGKDFAGLLENMVDDKLDRMAERGNIWFDTLVTSPSEDRFIVFYVSTDMWLIGRRKQISDREFLKDHMDEYIDYYVEKFLSNSQNTIGLELLLSGIFSTLDEDIYCKTVEYLVTKFRISDSKLYLWFVRNLLNQIYHGKDPKFTVMVDSFGGKPLISETIAYVLIRSLTSKLPKHIIDYIDEQMSLSIDNFLQKTFYRGHKDFFELMSTLKGLIIPDDKHPKHMRVLIGNLDIYLRSRMGYYYPKNVIKSLAHLNYSLVNQGMTIRVHPNGIGHGCNPSGNLDSKSDSNSGGKSGGNSGNKSDGKSDDKLSGISLYNDQYQGRYQDQYQGRYQDQYQNAELKSRYVVPMPEYLVKFLELLEHLIPTSPYKQPEAYFPDKQFSFLLQLYQDHFDISELVQVITEIFLL